MNSLLSFSISETIALLLSSNGEKKVTTVGSVECLTLCTYSSSLDDPRLKLTVTSQRKAIDIRHELSDKAISHIDRPGSESAVRVWGGRGWTVCDGVPGAALSARVVWDRKVQAAGPKKLTVEVVIPLDGILG